jgi:hypothetical protein
MSTPVRDGDVAGTPRVRRRIWEPQGALLGCILLGAVIGIPFAILGYRHSWAWGYAGIVIIAAGTVIGVLFAFVLQWRLAGLQLRTIVISAVVLYWVISAVTGLLHNHLRRTPDYQWIAGFRTGQSIALAHPALTNAIASCQQDAGNTQTGNNRPARYLRGCLDGVHYQRAHPQASMDPGQLPPGVQAATVQVGSQ